jgi:hypothetical protein
LGCTDAVHHAENLPLTSLAPRPAAALSGVSLVWSDAVQLLHVVLLIVGALLLVINPPGNVPILLNLTRGCDVATRRDLARHIAVYSLALLFGSLVLGSLVLRLFDLSVAALLAEIHIN